MKLKEYLNERSTSLLRWCRDNKLPYFSIRNILKGQDCFLSTAIQIEKITKGAVRCIEMEPKKVLKHLEKLKGVAKKNDVHKKEKNQKIEKNHTT